MSEEYPAMARHSAYDLNRYVKTLYTHRRGLTFYGKHAIVDFLESFRQVLRHSCGGPTAADILKHSLVRCAA